MGPNKTLIRCPYCSGTLYHLGDGMKKCAACRQKFSPAKAQKDLDLIALFCRGETARNASQILGIGYQSVTARYKRLRLLAAAHLEKAYEAQRGNVKEFEEYVYLEASKRHDKSNIFDAHNFITFDYGGKVYNLLMPDLHRYKQAFLDDGLDALYYEKFVRFLRLHRIAKLEKKRNTITAFWDFFEATITRYKGVKTDYFVYYLKEAEFKFNYAEAEQFKLLSALWFVK